MIFALILTGILAIAILRCKDCAPKKVVKPRVRVKKK
jgi:DNA-directed RNA polymerase subunit RPC12/RpoP